MQLSVVPAYAAKALGLPLELMPHESVAVGDRDVRVSITHCGVCHTDIQAIDDYYDITEFPFYPGHEIAGTVSAVGRLVTDLKAGDRVGIGWQGRLCGECEWCRRGEEQLCRRIVHDATWPPYGGFSTSIVVDGRFAYPLPPNMPSEVAAPLMYAGITVYSALRSPLARQVRRLGILGVGGLGHLALQFAHALGYEEVTAISSSPDKRGQALALGADRFLLEGDKTALREAEFYFDALLATINKPVDWIPLIDTLKKNGQLILVGFPDFSLNSTDLVAHQLSVTGSFLGNCRTMREMLAFAARHNICPAIELMPMSQVNEALQKVRENKPRCRIVLFNESTAPDN